MFQVCETIFKKYGLGPKEKPKNTPYDLGHDPSSLADEFRTHGYSEVHMWYQPINFAFKDFEDYF